LGETLLRRKARESISFVKNLGNIGIEAGKFGSQPLRYEFRWEVPAAMTDVQDKRTWLFNFGALIRKEDMVEFDALHHFVENVI
jgi:hypothetical protein